MLSTTGQPNNSVRYSYKSLSRPTQTEINTWQPIIQDRREILFILVCSIYIYLAKNKYYIADCENIVVYKQKFK